MTASPVPPSELRACLASLVDHGERVWKAYQQGGPGSVEPRLFDACDKTYRRVADLLSDSADARVHLPAAWREEVVASAAQLHELARRCACTPQGLCFISGEAGLIPRQDQHVAYQRALETLNERLRNL